MHAHARTHTHTNTHICTYIARERDLWAVCNGIYEYTDIPLPHRPPNPHHTRALTHTQMCIYMQSATLVGCLQRPGFADKDARVTEGEAVFYSVKICESYLEYYCEENIHASTLWVRSEKVCATR